MVAAGFIVWMSQYIVATPVLSNERVAFYENGSPTVMYQALGHFFVFDSKDHLPGATVAITRSNDGLRVCTNFAKSKTTFGPTMIDAKDCVQ